MQNAMLSNDFHNLIIQFSDTLEKVHLKFAEYFNGFFIAGLTIFLEGC
jgi:hypothetical protein